MAARDRVVIDLVRCWNRMPTLVAGSDDVINVQILRDPANWAAAQLVPTAPPSIKRRLTNLYRRETFFSRKGYYDGYQYQQIIEAAINRDHPLFRFSRPTVDELRRAPAYIRLLAFWWGANTTLARSLMAANQTYVAVSLSEFSTNPKQQIARIAAAAGWSNTHVDVGAVRVARESFGTTSPLWKSAAQWLAIPVDIVTEGGGTAARMVDAFRRAEQY
ncbi:hypothetical protein STA1M1_31050 [Sinisalibacter aestuarii]|uniref:Uncharacterized protein n=2 Tax=Sinisalibacter aestuarii TaxID=2949426 RepID=A0ABQ5LW77_9RHOB|nr:hypothetical protein STA1M1_31050 [Sinisalibacter aestuarii]